MKMDITRHSGDDDKEKSLLVNHQNQDWIRLLECGIDVVDTFVPIGTHTYVVTFGSRNSNDFLYTQTLTITATIPSHEKSKDGTGSHPKQFMLQFSSLKRF